MRSPGGREAFSFREHTMTMLDEANGFSKKKRDEANG
jgi:hypothetical protein